MGVWRVPWRVLWMCCGYVTDARAAGVHCVRMHVHIHAHMQGDPRGAGAASGRHRVLPAERGAGPSDGGVPPLLDAR